MRDAYCWLVAGGLLQVPAVEAAHSLGLKVIVSDRNPACACAPLADVFLPLDTGDVDGHVRTARDLAARLPIVGVFTEGADVEVTVAAMAARLDLPGIPPDVARICKNKMRMRYALNDAGVSPVRFYQTDNLTHNPIGYPVMVKAVDNCASRGVHRVEREEDLPAAFSDAVANSTNGMVLLEEVLTGPQQSVEIIWLEGQPVALNIVDRIFAGDGVTELGHVNPTALGRAERNALYDMTIAASRAVGVTWGVFKADTIWTPAGPRILECTARLSGGFDCQYTTPLATGRNFIRAAMAQACGMFVDVADLTPRWHKYAAAWAAFPKPGVVREIKPAPAGSPPEFVRVAVGDRVEHRHNADRAGFVVVAADDYEGALTAARTAAMDLADRIITE